MQVFFRHENIRPVQKQIIKDACAAFLSGRHLIVHAPTGCGKTDALLSPAISYALENDKSVFFMTPKISQHRLAVQAINELREKQGVDIRGVDLVGKKHMCINRDLMEKDANDFYDLCQKKIKNHECPHFITGRGHNVRQRSEAKARLDEILSWYQGMKSFEELKQHCVEHGRVFNVKPPCPYEISMQIAEKARLIICDYYHVLNPYISRTFLERVGKGLMDSVLVIDEGHNVPSRLRKAMSAAIDEFVVQKAIEECMLVDNDALAEKMRKLKSTLQRLGSRRAEDETIAYPEELPAMKGHIMDMEETGLRFLEAMDRHRSYLMRIARFFQVWEQDNPAFLRILRKTERGVCVEFKCLDPSVVTGGILNEAHSTILMSATLKPGEMYRDLLGLDPGRTSIKEYGSPFPGENRLSLIDAGVSTRYERRTYAEYEKTAEGIAAITNNTPGNSAVFFPSYKLMRGIMPVLHAKLNKRTFTQTAQMSPDEIRRMIRAFQNGHKEGAVLLAVSGGSLAEGIDLPGDYLKAVVVLGVPLNEPDLETKALIQYYEYKYGKGWEYGYTYPAMSKAVQAAGRCIRTDNDRGVIVFMDERFGWKKYSQLIPKEYELRNPKDIAAEVRAFWE